MSTLDEFIVEMAAQVAQTRGWSLLELARWIEQYLEEARKEYRELGAPLGDTDEGFVAWISPRERPPAA